MLKLLKSRSFIIFVILVVSLFGLFPIGFTLAQTDTNTGLVPCGRGTAGPNDCTFYKLIELIQNVIHFMIYDIAFPLAVILTIYAGGKMVWYSSTNPGKVKEAKGFIWNIIIGFAIMLIAYIAVQEVLSIFVDTGVDTPIQKAMKLIFRDYSPQ